jgi:hypothetical protein
MTTPTPQKTPAAAAAPAKPQAAAPKPSAEQRLQSILTADTQKSAGGDDILSDGKQKPPVKKKPAPAKPNAEAPAKPKAAQQGHAEGDEGADDAATGEGDGNDPLDADTKTAPDDGDTETVLDGDPDADTDGADGEEGDQEGDDDDGTLYKVKVAGKELEVPLSELIKGYSRTADYQQKTAAVAKERKEVEAIKESVKDLPQQRETYVKQAEFFGTAATAVKIALQSKFMPQPPNPELAKTDPAAYFAQQKNHEDAKQFTAAIEQQLGQIQTRLVTEAKEQHQKAVKESRVKLYDAMPDMAQPVARQKLREYANSLGFSDQAIQNETNHVLFVCVEKARRWDELQAKKASMKPKAPIEKVTRRTNAAETGRAVKQRAQGNAIAEHSKAKTIQSAEKALMAIFSGG